MPYSQHGQEVYTATDNPPTSCSVSLSRDCGSSGCVVTAIQNYTQRLLDTYVRFDARLAFSDYRISDLSAAQRQEALLFVGMSSAPIVLAFSDLQIFHLYRSCARLQAFQAVHYTHPVSYVVHRGYWSTTSRRELRSRRK